ncbi:MAG: cytochrome c biogenesis protein [Crocosphaera sp.]|nr:cytochrome c biogenesis protein [Crocosphaera sp.]
MKQQFFKFVADLRSAISILLLISFFSIIGTIIEQDQSIEIYKENYPIANPIFGILSWDLILKFGLDHVYRTWWFFLLIFFFGLSLISCTFLQQFPSLKIARRCQFLRKANQFYRFKNFTTLNDFAFNKILFSIKQNNYSIFQQKNVIYCYKGLIGRIAPILVHFSMILVLLGNIVGSLGGFKAQELIPKTEIFHIQNILNNGQLTIIPKTSARINDFWITYNSNKTVSQFYSDISILTDKGKEINRKTLSVNSPLIHRNIYYYQTDWNLLGLRIQTTTNEVQQYPLINILDNKNKIWLSWISTNQSLIQGVIILMDNLEGYCSVYSETGKLLGNIELQEIGNFKNSPFLIEILAATGLQIKNDPGIPIIYSGFFFLMISTLLSYITYSQIWMIIKKKKLLISGTTNRAIFDFELEFLKIIQ